MTDMKIHFVGVYNIDHNNSEIPLLKIEETEGVNEWIEKLLDGTNKANKRRFIFPSESTEVISSVNNLLKTNEYESNAQVIADRLLREEQKAIQKIGHIKDLQKGSLIQLFFTYNELNTYLLAKVDHEPFLDESDFIKRIGLPFNKQIYKIALLRFNNENNFESLNVSDSNAKISVYWKTGFLESEEVTDDDKNTDNAFNAIERLLKRRIGKKYKSDYTNLRNNLVTYFRTNKSYAHDAMVETVVGAYEPEDPEVDVDSLINELQELPSTLSKRYVFDTSFDISQEVAKKKYKRTIRLSDKIDLFLKEDIDNIKDTIFSREENGKKYVMIESEEGYRKFPKKQAEQNE